KPSYESVLAAGVLVGQAQEQQRLLKAVGPLLGMRNAAESAPAPVPPAAPANVLTPADITILTVLQNSGRALKRDEIVRDAGKLLKGCDKTPVELYISAGFRGFVTAF